MQGYRLAFNSFKKPFSFLSDSIIANLWSAFLLFFKKSLAPSIVYFLSLNKLINQFQVFYIFWPKQPIAFAIFFRF